MNDKELMRSTIGDDDWSRGPRSAAVTLVEYLDFECPDSRQLRGALAEILQRYGVSARLVIRHFPIAAKHRHAEAAAEAAEAAGVQGKFWEMHDRLLAHPGALEMADILHFAAELGLDRERFAHHLADDSYRERVRRDLQRGAADGVTDTPALFINGRRYAGPHSVEALATAIDVALAS